MPTPSDFGDGVTVVEGPTPSQAHAHGAHVPQGATSSRGKGVETLVETSEPTKTSGGYRDITTFAKTSDYFSEERPFVVRIGKNGVIGALRTLDEHLRNVCFFSPTLITSHARLPLTTDLCAGLVAGGI